MHIRLFSPKMCGVVLMAGNRNDLLSALQIYEYFVILQTGVGKNANLFMHIRLFSPKMCGVVLMAGNRNETESVQFLPQPEYEGVLFIFRSFVLQPKSIFRHLKMNPLGLAFILYPNCFNRTATFIFQD